jgi:hypothetical protein
LSNYYKVIEQLKSPKESKKIVLISGISIFSIIFLSSVIFNVFPLGIKGQWFYPHNNEGIFPVAEWITGGIIFFAMYVLINFATENKAASRRNKKIILFAVVLLSLFFDIQVLKSGRMGMGENLLAIYDPFATGYFEKALEIKSSKDFLGNFHKNQRYKGRINHSDVHPPGRTLLSYYIYKVIKNFPSLKSVIINTMPLDMEDVFAQIKNNGLLTQFNFSDEVKAAGILHLYLFLLILMLGKLFMAMIVWKVYGHDSALQNSIIYVFIPTTILFFGHYDGLLATVTAFVILFALWEMPVKYIFWKNIFLGFCCSFFILQSIAVALPCMCLALFWFFSDYGKPLKEHVRVVFIRYFLPYGIGIMVFIAVMWSIYDFFLPQVLFSCLYNNEMFFKNQSTRSIIWKLINPAEFLTGAGISVFLVLVAAGIEYIKSIRKGVHLRFFRLSQQNALELASFICLLLLLFTPTRAEVARQWSLACPFVYILAIKAIEHYKFTLKQRVVLGVIQVAQIFIFRFYLEIVLMHP